MTETSTSFELAVETHGLTKTFKGPPPRENQSWTSGLALGVGRLLRPAPERTVLDGVDLAVRRGEFFGLLGANGAGKTTFLKLISCMLYPDGGEGRVNGFDLRRQRSRVRRSVAIAKAQAWNGVGLLWQLSGRENLLFRARLSGSSQVTVARRVDDVLERLELSHKADENTWNWSTGELQKLSLAMTFVTPVPLVVLDEPTSHLDPRTARLVREFAREDLNQSNGQTVIMSTHYLEEADVLCDRVAILHEGKLLACGTPTELKTTHGLDEALEIRALNYTAEIGRQVREKCDLAELLEHFEDDAMGRVRLRPKWPGANGDEDRLRSELQAAGVQLVSLRRVPPTMDDVYFHLAKERAH